ncbi:hypothetical protein ENUP19_0009G0015 [Entamoeba nuttalli]
MSINTMFPPLSAKGGKRNRNKGQQQSQQQNFQQQTPQKTEKPAAKVEQSPKPSPSFNLPDLPPETCQLIADLADIEKRLDSLNALSVIADKHPDLAIPLWYSYGTVVILLEEIVSVYPYISGKHKETLAVSSYSLIQRVCKALALLQTIASHPKTQHFLIGIDIIYFLTPIFALTQVEREIEYLRLTSLGVIGAMSKTRDPQIVKYLMDKEVLMICIVSIQHAAEISRVIATFILSKLFSESTALENVCETPQKILSIANLLCHSIVTTVMQKRDVNGRLVRYSLDCLNRLSTNPKATPQLHSVVTEYKGLFKDHLLEYIVSKEPSLKPKYDEFCRNISFSPK